MKLSKISFPFNYREYFTVSEVNSCKLLLKSLCDGTDGGKLDLHYEVDSLVSLGSDGKMCLPGDVLSASAEFAKNSNVEFDRFCEGSGLMDVWITVKAFHDFYGFYVISGYLSDIWEIGSYNHDEIKGRLYIREFKEVKRD